MINRLCVLTFLVVLGFAALTQAQTFATIYNFIGGSDGANPIAGVIQDQNGNLYGTASQGGIFSCSDWYGCGVVYELDATGTETVLHSFTGGADGAVPMTPVTRDEAGNIYGTTYLGGGGYGGTIFKIDPAGNETVLYDFPYGGGCWPVQGLVLDTTGNLYGTAETCGAFDAGTIFKLDSAGNFTLLHSFKGPPSDGAHPTYGHLTMDKSGNLYGVTPIGGSDGCGHYGCGVLYRLEKGGLLKVLHRFGDVAASDGCYPYGSVARDEAGNFYGTTAYCGNYDIGTIWKVSKGKESILHNFAGGASDGCRPFAGVTRDPDGNLYGVTDGCGVYGAGVLYELSASGTFTVLHSFNGMDGAAPYGKVRRAANGTLYGTTLYGGAYICEANNGCGTVWSYLP